MRSNEKVHEACEVRLRLFFANLMDLLQERCFSRVIDPDTQNKRRIGYIRRDGEDTRRELDDIYWALSQLADKQKQAPTDRKPVGFAAYNK